MNDKIKAVAYYRTSSATSLVDGKKESEDRQRAAVCSYASKNDYLVSNEFYDKVVRGDTLITDRIGFNDLLEYIADNEIKIILVENAGRFARDTVVQITGYEYLKSLGVTIIPVDSPQHFIDDENPSSELIRTIIGAVSQWEKKSLVNKMKSARDRIRKTVGRCEGRKPAPEEVRKLAKEMRYRGMSYRKVSKELFKLGHSVMKTVVEGEGDNKVQKRIHTDKPYGAQSVKVMIG